MCVSKVSVRDILHPSNPLRRNWFDCGRCPACMQKKANRRSSRIRNHSVAGFTPFFVTLKYDNRYIPFILKSELIKASLLVAYSHKSQFIPIYRSLCKPIRRRDGLYFFPKKEIIDYYELKKSITNPNSYESLGFLRVKLTSNPDTYSFVDDCVSIAYNRDMQKMFNRLRQRLFRLFKTRQNISYYMAPEYGPTAQRFHQHACVWLPSSLEESKVRTIFDEIWPFENRSDSDKKTFCQVARDASHYLASYVNCGANVSELLQTLFPLRHSHSFGFGFSNQYFQLPSIINQDSTLWSFKYPFLRKLPNGQTFTDFAFYPKYVIYRYFPKLKGFGRLPRYALFNAYYHAEEYLRPSGAFASSTPLGINPFSKEADYKTPRFNKLIQFNGEHHSISLYEYDLFVNRLKRTFVNYYKPLGYDFFNFCKIVISYLIRRPLEFYKDSQQQNNEENSVFSFFNLSDVKLGYIHHPYISNYLGQYSLYNLHPNRLTNEINETNELVKQFNCNIKHRKINAL